jgi:hypothetical protein
MQWWTKITARWEQLKKDYGRVAIGTYLTLWVLVLAGYVVAIKMGIDVEGATGAGGVLLGAWVAAKVSQPVRIVLTLVLTPFIAGLLKRPPALGEE